MSVIDITSIEDISEVSPEIATVEPTIDTVSTPDSPVPIEVPVDVSLPDIHTDTMPTAPVTSLLDITEPTPTINILDIGNTIDTATLVSDPITVSYTHLTLPTNREV